jgi:hypothetical protein
VIDKTIAGGTWKLRLENESAAQQTVLIVGWTDPNPLRLSLTTSRPTPMGQIGVQARLTNSGSPVTGAAIEAILLTPDGGKQAIRLIDDGRTGDGAAGDGVYGAAVPKLANGSYGLEATAVAGTKSLGRNHVHDRRGSCTLSQNAFEEKVDRFAREQREWTRKRIVRPPVGASRTVS